MPVVTRLLTYADLDPGADDRRMSVSARHEAELDDGRHVLLLDDRGWSASGSPGLWARTSVEEVIDTTRMVVGPDEPFGGRSYEDAADNHWAQLAGELERHGVAVDAADLRWLPHDVLLSDRLRARLGEPAG